MIFAFQLHDIIPKAATSSTSSPCTALSYHFSVNAFSGICGLDMALVAPAVVASKKTLLSKSLLGV
jgi:hypothetical protein